LDRKAGQPVRLTLLI